MADIFSELPATDLLLLVISCYETRVPWAKLSAFCEERVEQVATAAFRGLTFRKAPLQLLG